MKESQDELKAIIKSAKLRLDEIEAHEVKQQDCPVVGKCFRHQNSYSPLHNDNRYWPLYLMITRDDSHYLYGIRFEKDPSGEIAITPNCEIPAAWSDDYKQISRTEFITEWRKLLDTKRGEYGYRNGIG